MRWIITMVLVPRTPIFFTVIIDDFESTIVLLADGVEIPARGIVSF
jgi:hypothetical protein